MEAFRRAAENNLPYVEFDVWMTKDKIPIIIHGGDNGEIEYESEEFNINSQVKINELKYSQIKHIVLPNGEHIPTLSEMMDEFRGKFTFVLDLKEPNPEILKIIVNFIIEKQFYDKFILFSYIPSQMDAFVHLAYDNGIISGHESTPYKVKIGYVYFDIGSVKQVEHASKDCWIVIDAKMITKEIVDNIKQKEGEVGCYFYPASEETEKIYTKLLFCGVDYIIPDNPEQLRTYLEKMIKN